MNYAELLAESFASENGPCRDPEESRIAFLAVNVFDFNTYDSEMDELFGAKAVEVCAAINDRKTFDYIADEDNYRWYLLLCHTPFFADRIEWGTSIRGAWWRHDELTLSSCGLYRGTEQLTHLAFDHDEWRQFIAAVIEFAKADLVTSPILTQPAAEP